MLHFSGFETCQILNACKIVGAFVARSHRLCDVRKVRLRATLARVAVATIFLLVMSAGSISYSKSDGVKRISSINKDLGEVRKIYLHAGLVSTLEFKQAVIGVKVGNTDSIKAEISPSNPKEVTLRLKHQSAEPTNMIVRVDRQVYVFDLIPSRVNHQDYVKITNSFGGPSRESNKVGDEGATMRSLSKQQPRLLESIKLGVGE